MQLAVMIEGQDDLNWRRWQAIASAVEDLGFVGLYRSDHFTNPTPPDKDSLELWVSLTWLASHTRRIEFGPLVSPVSFRDPIFTARMAKDVDNLSEGRLTLGIGAGWEAREHNMFGYNLLETEHRFRRFEEGATVITRLLRSEEPLNFEGAYYTLREAILLPRPARPGGPPILIGGNGPQRTLPMVARFADEWNGVFITAQRFAELNAQLDRLLLEQGRRLSDVRRSLMTRVVFGQNEESVQQKLGDDSAEQMRAEGMIVGTGDAVRVQLDTLARAGVQRVMLQWLELDALDDLEALAKAVL